MHAFPSGPGAPAHAIDRGMDVTDAPGVWNRDQLLEYVTAAARPPRTPPPVDKEWRFGPVDEPTPEITPIRSLDEALAGLALPPVSLRGIRLLTQQFTGYHLVDRMRRLLTSQGIDDQRIAMVVTRVQSIRRMAKADQVATGKRGGRITGYRTVDGKQVPVYGSTGKRKFKNRLDTAHAELREAAKAHNANPTAETATRFDAAHAAMQEAARSHVAAKEAKRAKREGKAAPTAPKPTPAATARKPGTQPDKPGGQGGKAGAQPDPSDAQPKPSLPVDREPLAAGIGPFQETEPPVPTVKPETDASAADAERSALRREVEALHAKLEDAAPSVSGELVPMFNALKADMRRLFKTPTKPAVAHATKKTTAFLGFVRKLVQAMVSTTVRFSKSGKLPEYLATRLAVDEVDREPLLGSSRITFRPAQLSLASAALDDAVSREAELCKALDLVDREAHILQAAPLAPTRSPLHVGEVRLSGGLVAKIDVRAGDYRSGISEDGEAWSVAMPVHYGCLDGVDGADGDDLDVFVGPDLHADKVYVATLVNAAGDFDEHKVLVGLRDAVDVGLVLDAVYGEARARVSNYVEMSYAAFLDWIDQQPHRLQRAARMAALSATTESLQARLAKASRSPPVSARDALLAALGS